MRKTTRVFEWRPIVLSGVGLLVFSMATSAAEPVNPVEAQFDEAPMRVSTEGQTYEELMQRQEELNIWLMNEMPAAALLSGVGIQLSDAEIDAVENAPVELGTPLQIGVVRPLSPVLQVSQLTAKRSKVVRPTADGGYVWAASVSSANAGAIRIHIENMSLPANAELYFYSQAGEAFGPYTAAGPNGTGEFWTESVFGPEGVLQLRIQGPATPADLAAASFIVTEVGHIGARFVGQVMDVTAGISFCGNVPCIVDASCYSGANSIKDAYAKMEWVAGAFLYTCTGGLLNDNNPSQNNYFLTANHCLSKNNVAQNVQFYWRFRTSSCNGACPSNSGWPYKTTGSTLRATGRKADFTLLQLNSNPPAGSVFLGWTTTPVANSNGVALHRVSNPNFGPQVYSEHTVNTTVGTCTGWPRGERIYSKDTLGATDGGSSGSPVVNSSDQVVGQLSGACGFNPGDPCDTAANATVDGAFAYYYNTVKPFINP